MVPDQWSFLSLLISKYFTIDNFSSNRNVLLIYLIFLWCFDRIFKTIQLEFNGSGSVTFFFKFLPVRTPVGLHGVILLPFLSRLNLDVQVAFFNTITQCLKITKKVSFNIASEASYVYILSSKRSIF